MTLSPRTPMERPLCRRPGQRFSSSTARDTPLVCPPFVCTKTVAETAAGNLLTTELRKNPSVDYAGYKVSHPHDHSFELRIHMAPRRKEGYEAKDAVTDACKDLMADLGILSKRITAECYIYQAATQGRINTGDCDDKTPYSAAHHPGRHFAAGDFDAATQRPSTPPAGSIFGQLSNEWDFMSFLATSEDFAQADPPTVGSMIPGVFPGAGGEGGGMGGNNLGPPRA